MQNYICANWKMHKTKQEAAQTVSSLISALQATELTGAEVVIFPAFTALDAVVQALESRPELQLGAQNFYPALEGAYTGEISLPMLQDSGCSYVLVGHSERRHVLGEDNEFVGRKLRFALQQGMKAILCIGETLQQRKQDQVSEILSAQLQSALQDISQDRIKDSLLVAYEPVWAIGTGEVAREQDIAQAHSLVLEQLLAWFPKEGQQIPILYGGSVKPENSRQIMDIDNVHGLLVGGASLKAEAFSKIVQSGCKA
ncbi:MAG: triose-phosphate isomerase [Thermodesulfobacteriota bacterium]